MLAIIAIPFFRTHLTYKEPTATARIFITSLANQNWDQAEKVSSGRTLYTIKTRREQVNSLYAANVVDLDIQVTAASKKWASAHVVAETELSDGEVDVLWYDLLLQNDNGWKIYRVTPTLPELSGTPGLKTVDNKSIQAIKDVFYNYLASLSQSKFEEVKKYLVGLSRQKFEIQQDMLGERPVIKDFKDLQIEPVWHKDKTVVSRVSYVADSRPVSVMVWMYHSSDGWKIANVESI